MRSRFLKVFAVIIGFLLVSCEREIEIELPDAQEKLVVEGFIEPGMPPLVFLTKSMGYFEPTDFQTLQNIFIKDAKVSVTVNGQKVPLESICIDNLPDFALPIISNLSGLSPEQLRNFNYCFYTSLNTSIFGKIGATYKLEISHDGREYSAVTSIPTPVPLDSLWFKKRDEDRPEGVVWLKFNDPPNVYNAYRLYSKRTNVESTFKPTAGSVFEDKFFDGQPVEFFYYPQRNQDGNQNDRFVKEGDTVVVKFCSIDAGVFRFLREFEVSKRASNNPFAAPMTVTTNIIGGALGYWGGYGAYYDTIVAGGGK
jgi:hypothetical protein